MRLALDERASRFSIQGILVPFVEKVNLAAAALSLFCDNVTL